MVAQAYIDSVLGFTVNGERGTSERVTVQYQRYSFDTLSSFLRSEERRQVWIRHKHKEYNIR